MAAVFHKYKQHFKTQLNKHFKHVNMSIMP